MGDWNKLYRKVATRNLPHTCDDCQKQIHKGEVFWRIKNMPNNWAETMGNEYSVTTTPGKKLYVNFDTNKAEVK